MRHLGNRKPNERKRRLTSKSTREALIQAAINLFYQKGYLDTSIREIGAKAGISNSIIYHYFKNKEEVLYEIINHATKELIEALVRVDREVSDPVECLTEMLVEHSAIFSLKRRKETKIVDSDSFFLHGKWREATVAQQRQIYQLYKSKLHEIAGQGILKEVDVTVAAFSILGIINSSFRWFKESGVLSRDEVARDITKLVFGGIIDSGGSGRSPNLRKGYGNKNASGVKR
jgi:TetR/AcrR family transcriptional regulator, cholesterol catabolism regulator